jgi:hypothetical protein
MSKNLLEVIEVFTCDDVANSKSNLCEYAFIPAVLSRQFLVYIKKSIVEEKVNYGFVVKTEKVCHRTQIWLHHVYIWVSKVLYKVGNYVASFIYWLDHLQWELFVKISNPFKGTFKKVSRITQSSVC